jgi:hypothetical protein
MQFKNLAALAALLAVVSAAAIPAGPLPPILSQNFTNNSQTCPNVQSSTVVLPTLNETLMAAATVRSVSRFQSQLSSTVVLPTPSETFMDAALLSSVS